MRKQTAVIFAVLVLCSCTLVSWSQSAQAGRNANATVPRLVRFGGTARDINGSAASGVVGITFGLYAGQNGGAPLWLETQNVQVDSSGHYTVLLGATKPDGLPAELFTSEQARWIGMQVSGAGRAATSAAGECSVCVEGAYRIRVHIDEEPIWRRSVLKGGDKVESRLHRALRRKREGNADGDNLEG